MRTPPRFEFDDWTCVIVVLLAAVPGWASGAIAANQCGQRIAYVGDLPSHWWGDLAVLLPVVAVLGVSMLRRGRWRMRVLLLCLLAQAGLPFLVGWFAATGTCP